MIRTVQRALEVAQHDVHPAGIVGLSRRAAIVTFDDGVGMAQIHHRTERP